MNQRCADQIGQTYRRMAKEVKYRPAAPSDGWGNITGPLNLKKEAEQYTETWWAEEEKDTYWMGCPDFRGRPALIFTIEGARLICGMSYKRAAKLLRMAADELDNLADGI